MTLIKARYARLIDSAYIYLLFFFILFPLTIMTISDNKIKSNPHRYAEKAYFMKSYGGGTKNKSASPIFPISVYVVNLHTNHKKHKTHQTPK